MPNKIIYANSSKICHHYGCVVSVLMDAHSNGTQVVLFYFSVKSAFAVHLTGRLFFVYLICKRRDLWYYTGFRAGSAWDWLAGWSNIHAV